MDMLRTKWKQWRDHLLQRLPFSEQNGVRAMEQGALNQWLERSERISLKVDSSVGLTLSLSAFCGMLALMLTSDWLAGLAGLAMAAALFSMAAEIWIDEEAEKVRERFY